MAINGSLLVVFVNSFFSFENHYASQETFQNLLDFNLFNFRTGQRHLNIMRNNFFMLARDSMEKL